MIFLPFSIADIDDPENIRVVLYASGKMGHAPLNALLEKMRQNIGSFDKKITTNMTQILQRLDALEQQLEMLQNISQE
ncbi:hypothetical protein [Bartonella sp. B30(2025)]